MAFCYLQHTIHLSTAELSHTTPLYLDSSVLILFLQVKWHFVRGAIPDSSAFWVKFLLMCPHRPLHISITFVTFAISCSMDISEVRQYTSKVQRGSICLLYAGIPNIQHRDDK